MKKTKLLLLVFSFLLSHLKLSAQMDTIQVNGFRAAMDMLYGALDTTKLNTQFLINRAPVDSSFYFFDGKKDSANNYLSFLLHYNTLQLAQKRTADENPFIPFDSAARSKPYIPIGINYHEYDFISDFALASGNLSLVNGQIVNADANLNPFEKATYFSACPMNLISPASTTFRLDSDFVFTNKTLSTISFRADFNDGIGFRNLAFNQDYNVNLNMGKNTFVFYLINGTDTLKSKSFIFVASSAESNEVEKLTGFCNYIRPDILPQEISSDPNYGLIKEGNPKGRFAVWLGCGNDNNGEEENTLSDIRKPYIVSGGFNPLNGKALDPCSASDLDNPNPFNLLLQFSIASALSGLISATTSGLVNIPAFAELSAFLYETNFYGGWRGPIYETYNGTYNSLFSPNDPKNENNGTNYFEKLREEGYDIVIITYNNPVDYIENNASVLISLIKLMNNQLRLNGSKHELIVGGYSAGALTSRIALAEMEKYYFFNKGTPNEFVYPHPHTRLFMSVEGEYQGANTPLGFQHFINYLCSSPATTPIEIMEVMLANLTRKQFSNHTAKELSIVHYQGTINGMSANQNPERDDFSLLQSQLGFPQSCRKVGISQGNALALEYQEINPSIPMFQVRSNRRTGLPPFITIGYYREYTAHHTPKNTSLAILASRSEGISFSFFGNSVYFNLINTFNNGHTHINNCKPYDECPGSLLAADKTFDQSGAKLLFGVLSTSTNPFAGNLYYHQGTNHSFAPTVSALDLHNPLNLAEEADLYFNPVNNGLMKAFHSFGQAVNSANRDFGYPHISYPSNHYSITPFDAIWAVGDNTKAENHFHVEDPQPLMCNFMVGEVVPEQLYLSNRTINEPCLAYNYLNLQSGSLTSSSQYQAAFDARRKIFCGNDVYYITSTNQNNQILAPKELTPNGDFIIGTNADVEFTAGEEINLMPGFEVSLGANFFAGISEHTCGNTYEINKQLKSPEMSSIEAGKAYGAEAEQDATKVQIAESNTFRVFPIPANDRIEIVGNFSNKPLEASLIDIFGEEVWTRNLTEGNNILFLNQLQNGIYLLNLSEEGKVIQSTKIIIQHP